MTLKLASSPNDTIGRANTSIIPMVPFKLSVNNIALTTAHHFVNDYFRSDRFKSDLKSYHETIGKNFDMADTGPNLFVIVLCDTLAFIPVVHIRTKWMVYKSVYASVYSNQPFAMYLNSRNLVRFRNQQRNIASLAGTIGHEFIHILDAYSPYSFGHGDNKSIGKERTLPYWIGKKIQEYVLEQYGITKEVL